MKAWAEMHLGQLVKIKHGFAFKGEQFSDHGDFILLTPGNVYPKGGLKLKGDRETYYSGDFPRSYVLTKGDLIVVMTDLTQDASILGGAMVIDESNRYLHNQRLGLVSHTDEIDRHFLYQYLNWQFFRDQVKASSSGATVKHTSPGRIYRCRIFRPPIPIQRKIAAVLSAYDELIENNKRRIALLEKLAEEIYREWFVRLRFPGHEKTNKSKGIPDGWQVKKIGELVRTQYGYTASAESSGPGPKFLRITDIVPPSIDWELVPHCTIEEANEEKYLLHEGDIVVARTGATVGYAKRMNKTHPRAVFASYLVRLIPNNKSDAIFLGLSVERDAFKDFISMFVSGAAQPQANATTMSLFPVLHPPEPLLEEFNRIVEPILDQKAILLDQVAQLSRTRDLLLPRLISGKLCVENLDIQFPPGMDEELNAEPTITSTNA